MSRFIIIDTCVWIGLAREPNLYDLLETLKTILEKNNFVLVLPKSVKIEFERHRVQIKADWNNKCKGLISAMKDSRKHFPDHAEDLLKLHNDIQNALANPNSHVENNLKLVDALLAEIKEELPKYYEYVSDRDSWFQPTICPSCKTISALPYVYSTGYRYICKNCGGASPFITSDDPFY